MSHFLTGRRERGVANMEGFTFQPPPWVGIAHDYSSVQSPPFLEQHFVIGMCTCVRIHVWVWSPVYSPLNVPGEDPHLRPHPTTPTTPHHFSAPHPGHFAPPPTYHAPSPTTPTAFHPPASRLVLHQAPPTDVVSDLVSPAMDHM